MRMWYEPEYLDKILRLDLDPCSVYADSRVHLPGGDAGVHLHVLGYCGSAGARAARVQHLRLPDGHDAGANCPRHPALLSFGYGLTTFDANFDGTPDIVHLHSERSLDKLTGINADFQRRRHALRAGQGWRAAERR